MNNEIALNGSIKYEECSIHNKITFCRSSETEPKGETLYDDLKNEGKIIEDENRNIYLRDVSAKGKRGMPLKLEKPVNKEKYSSESDYNKDVYYYYKRLEEVFNIDAKNIEMLVMAHGIKYILYHCFDPVKGKPSNGDFIYGYAEDGHVGLGIFSDKYGFMYKFRSENCNYITYSKIFLYEKRIKIFYFLRMLNKPRIIPLFERGELMYTEIEKGMLKLDKENQKKRKELYNKGRLQKEEIKYYNKDLGVCYNYAINKIFKIYRFDKEFFRIMNTRKGIDLVLSQFFTRTSNLKKGTLLVYCNDKYQVVHFGLYRQHGMVESKWGNDMPYYHLLFDVPPEYGNRIYAFKLKPEVKISGEAFIKQVKAKVGRNRRLQMAYQKVKREVEEKAKKKELAKGEES